MTAVLKLGGSLITKKDVTETVDSASLDRVAHRLAASGADEVVLVHGGGSFGHPVASAHGVSRTTATRDPIAITAVGRAMGRLNEAVIDAFHAAGLGAVGMSCRPLACKRASGDVAVTAEPVRTMREAGFIPVVYGDLVAHAGAGASVLGGDQLAVRLAETLGADRVGLCADVSGVLDEDGRVIERIACFSDVEHLLDAPDGADVTGGIAWKVRTLLDGDVPGGIFGVDELGSFLEGIVPGTQIGA